MKSADNEQIKRIKKYERIYDRALSSLKRYNEAAERLERLMPDIKELISYYESEKWREDFDTDERGELPPDLKRGVLSEDGVYNMIEELDEVMKKIKN